MIITSNRKFGVEIEFFCPTRKLLSRVADMLTVVRDGSLDRVPNAGEYVSSILMGEVGEKRLVRACEILKKAHACGDDTAMSVHIHLDGRKSEPATLLSSSVRPPEQDVPSGEVICVSNKLERKLGNLGIRGLLSGVYFDHLNRSVFYDIAYYSLGEIKEQPTKNFTFYWLNKEARFKWLRNVLFFYTLYNDVMENMVSNSRKFGNMYCTPLGVSYNLEEIRCAKNMEQLKAVWYKNNESSSHYDNSRYHNVNLHSFWNRHGTVEIRSHGGTIDPYKILLWVKLHQKIMDKLEDMEIADLELEDGADVYREFLKFIEEPILQSYVKRLLGFYSNIIIK